MMSHHGPKSLGPGSEANNLLNPFPEFDSSLDPSSRIDNSFWTGYSINGHRLSEVLHPELRLSDGIFRSPNVLQWNPTIDGH